MCTEAGVPYGAGSRGMTPSTSLTDRPASSSAPLTASSWSETGVRGKSDLACAVVYTPTIAVWPDGNGMPAPLGSACDPAPEGDVLAGDVLVGDLDRHA